ncbi:spore gernimation protein [Pradoshia eiseniae]|uniref:Spore gernimation protein n=1 Tax=Pradoshia eiseniae TaxID=2064768 RepID=A0A2S7N343_9BACI|nr:glycoside hydrolase family 18 protein [Pradoshia eiseniae]PQD96446.1 spore gernimation protein [Pradoshia eiseniae]
MQIHVVRQGESIYSIAQAYNISANQIISSNALQAPNELVIGQALVIPITGRYHWVQQGETLYSIGRMFGVSPEKIADANNISINEPLTVGLRLYIPPSSKRDAEFNAYVEPRGSAVSETLEEETRIAAPHLTYLSLFSYQVLRDGKLKAPLLDNFPTIASDNGNALVMVVTNLENEGFSGDLASVILNNESLQDTLFNNIAETARRVGFRDIHFDFENLKASDRNAYTSFLRRAKARFSKEGWQISIALAPKTSANQKGSWYEAHDYKAQGAVVDWVLIMSYEWGYSGGPAQAVSPIGPVRRVLTYAISEIPSRKVMMGQNLYGYDWTLPFVKGSIAKAVSPQQAIALARQYKVEIKYDYTAQAPFFKYTDEDGQQHEVWFEDARSIQAKFNLVKELDLRGVSYWKLGLSFPQNWLLIQDNFIVTKI